MNLWKRVVVILLVCFLCIGCDQSSKYVASKHLPENTMTSYFGDTIRIEYTENTGAFLGLGKDMPKELRFLVFTVLVGLFLMAFLVYLLWSRSLDQLSLIGLSGIFAGGASNFIDRAMNEGAVVDFLNVGVGPLRTGIFNIADVAILLGVVLYFYSSYQAADSEVV